MLSDAEFRQFLTFFNRPWSGFRKVRKGVKKRIRRRMVEIGCPNLAAYLKLLAVSSEEAQLCEQCLLVSISRFFRDRQLWCYMQDQVIPRLLKNHPGPMRVWSAGCARGEEAYSLAILLAVMPVPPQVEILATDRHPECLKQAVSGVYNRSSLKEVPEDLKNRFFKALRGGRQYAIRAGSVPVIHWQEHNLLALPPPGPFHLIFLRNNLLTYYQGIQKQDAFAAILSVLAPGGYLVVGSHERVPQRPIGLKRVPDCPWVYKV